MDSKMISTLSQNEVVSLVIRQLESFTPPYKKLKIN